MHARQQKEKLSYKTFRGRLVRLTLPIRMKSLAILFALLFGPMIALQADDFEARTYTSPDGQLLSYRLLTPRNYDAKEKYPVVLFLHGAGERGSDNQAQLRHCVPLFLKADVREKYACFVVVPQVPSEQKWADVDWSANIVTQPPKPSPSMTMAMATLDVRDARITL